MTNERLGMVSEHDERDVRYTIEAILRFSSAIRLFFEICEADASPGWHLDFGRPGFARAHTGVCRIVPGIRSRTGNKKASDFF